jgi:peptidoglycan/LPS O-acetylase OafA/YrhL
VDTRSARFPLMDSVRAIAALSVVAFHAVYQANLLYRDSPLRPLSAHLDVGVPIFYLISGVLLYRPFAQARVDGERVEIAPYAWRRFLRIVPGYWLALTVAALAVPLTYVFSHPLRYYGFAQIYDGATVPGGLAQAWTLCVEMTFYAFLPLWALALRRLRRGVRTELLALAALYAASLAYQLVAVRHADPRQLSGPAGVWLMPLPAQLDQFALGMALAVLSAAPRSAAARARVSRLAVWGWALAAVAFVAVGYAIGLDGRRGEPISGGQWVAQHQLYGLVALGVLVPAVFAEGGLVARVLGHRMLLWLGLVSYGVYLYHVPVFTVLEQKGLIPTTYFPEYVVGGTLLSVALAAASYYALERPALRLKGRVPGRRSARLGAEAAAASAPAAPPPA